MEQKSLFSRMARKEDPQNYADKDGHLKPVLGMREMIAMGVGTVVGAGIFTMPGIVAAAYAGPAVVLSFVIAAIIAGLSALAYSEFASAMPFAGSIYSWANVIYGEFIGWLSGWAVLAEYLIALALISASWSSYFQGFLSGFGIALPKALTASFNAGNGTWFDLFGALSLSDTWYHVVLRAQPRLKTGWLSVRLRLSSCSSLLVQRQFNCKTGCHSFLSTCLARTLVVSTVSSWVQRKSSSLTSDSIRLLLTQLKLRMRNARCHVPSLVRC